MASSVKMGCLNDPSAPHLITGKRRYRLSRGEVGGAFKHFAQCTSIVRETHRPFIAGRSDCR